jgi:hypothetical protein
MGRILLSVSLVIAAGMIGARPASADDRSECAAGIAMLEAELSKATGAVRTKVERELRVARREQAEGEFDECMDAIRAARPALRQ